MHMKYLALIFIVFTLNANAIAGTSVCMMQDKAVAVQSHDMPCHDDTTSSDTQNDYLHFCDCDSCVHFAFTVVISEPINIGFEVPISRHFVNISYIVTPTSPPPITRSI